MRRLVTISALLFLLIGSFSVSGCDGENCKGLLAQLESLQNQIIVIAEKRRQADAKGEDVGGAVELYQQEVNARRNFAETKDRYEAMGCTGKTGDAPSLPPFEQIGETQFE